MSSRNHIKYARSALHTQIISCTCLTGANPSQPDTAASWPEPERQSTAESHHAAPPPVGAEHVAHRRRAVAVGRRKKNAQASFNGDTQNCPTAAAQSMWELEPLRRANRREAAVAAVGARRLALPHWLPERRSRRTSPGQYSSEAHATRMSPVRGHPFRMDGAAGEESSVDAWNDTTTTRPSCGAASSTLASVQKGRTPTKGDRGG